MKILKNEREKNRVKLEVEFPAKLLKGAIEKVYQGIAKDANVPGFRKGKAPKKLIESRIGKGEVLSQAAQNLISDSYPDIIKQAEIEPVDYPEVNVKNLDEGKPVVFSINVDVYPEAKLGKYKGIAVEAEDDAVGEKEVEDFLKDFRDRFAKFNDVNDRGIKTDDLAVLDISAKCEGGDVQSLSGKSINFAVGKGYISKEFDENLLQLKLGETKDFKTTIPDNSPVREVAGKEVAFNVEVKGIKEKELPNLDSAFIKSISGKESLDEFKSDIKERLGKAKKQRVESEIRDKLISEVSNEIEVDIPDGMIMREVDVMIDELKRSLERDRLTLDDYLRSTRKELESVREEMKKGAEIRVKGKISLRAVAAQEKIDVLDEDIEQEISVLAKGGGESSEEFKKRIGDGGIAFVKDYLLRRKALDFLVSKAKIKKKKAK